MDNRLNAQAHAFHAEGVRARAAECRVEEENRATLRQIVLAAEQLVPTPSPDPAVQAALDQQTAQARAFEDQVLRDNPPVVCKGDHLVVPPVPSPVTVPAPTTTTTAPPGAAPRSAPSPSPTTPPPARPSRSCPHAKVLFLCV